MNLHQVITKDSSNSRTIMWQSLNDRDNFTLEYTKDENNSIYEVVPNKKVLEIDGKTLYVYSAYLDNLEENTVYKYRIGYDDKRTEWKDLSTENNNTNDFKVLIFPDSQSNDYTDWENVAMNAWHKNQDANFFINMGDLVDNGYDLSQWDAWFKSTEDMITKIPVAPIMGNHETYTLDWKVAMPTAFLNFFDLPSNDKDEYKNMYYSYDYGDVHFTVINTQEDELKDNMPNLLEDEINWLKQDLASTDKKWKVVLMHRDILQYGRKAAPLGDQILFTSQGKNLIPIFDEYDVDAVLTAHLHTYRRRAKIRDFKPNEQGTLYILTGVAGNVRYPSLWERNPLDDYMPPQPETDNYIVMQASDDKLTFSAYLPDNSLLDSVTIEK